jgi:hypothetical protein
MTMRKFPKLGSLFVAGALASPGPAAHADQINTSGTVCKNFNASQALDIDFLANGVRNINAAPRPVICAIPRSPLPLGSNATFFVDGVNAPGTTTPCTVFTFDGTLHSATLSLPGVVTLTAGPFAYASVLCTLPGNAGTVVYGATSMP